MANETPEVAQDRTGWRLSATVRDTEARGREAGTAYGLGEGRAQTLARLLRRLARKHFGAEDATGQGLLLALESGWASDTMLDLSERLLAADSWSSWLAGVEAPPPVPGVPDYTKGTRVCLEPPSPSIDTTTELPFFGRKTVLLMRMQKVRDPDLDRKQYEEACRLERLHGSKPIIAVVLMWPAADDPAITGRYRCKDKKGRPVTFNYQLARAWEMPAERAFNAPTTMMVAPLTKGARERMPWIVEKMEKGMEAIKDNPKLIGTVWIAAYWAMGIHCTMDEVLAALGKRFEYIQSLPEYRSSMGNNFNHYHLQASQEASVTAARELVVRIARRRFGGNEAAETRLAGLTKLADLELLALRVLSVTGWEALVAGPREGSPS